MKVSVEISVYPLDQEYGTSIIKFIHRLKEYENLKVVSNTMSSQIFGPYEEVMDALSREIKATFSEGRTITVVMKMLNVDMRP